MGLQMKLRRIAEFEGMNDKKKQTLVFTKSFPRRLQSFCDSLMGEYVLVTNDSAVQCIGITQLVEFAPDEASKVSKKLLAFVLIFSSSVRFLWHRFAPIARL
jgi:superfamily II DNA/RNA helicase